MNRLKSRKIYKTLNNDVPSSCDDSICYKMIKKLIMYFNYYQTDEKFKFSNKSEKIAINFVDFKLYKEFPSYLEFAEINKNAISILKNFQDNPDLSEVIKQIPPYKNKFIFFNFDGFENDFFKIDPSLDEKIQFGKAIEENDNKSFDIADKRYSLFLILLQIIIQI